MDNVYNSEKGEIRNKNLFFVLMENVSWCHEKILDTVMENATL